MDNLKATLLPVEAWAGNAPDVLRRGRTTDIGALAEALVYYDKVVLNLDHKKNLDEILAWFGTSDSPDAFVRLIEEGTIIIYHYPFASPAIYDPRAGSYVLVNMKEEGDPRELYHRRLLGEVDRYFNTRRRRRRFLSAVEDSLVVANVDAFGPAIESAKAMVASNEAMQSVMDSMIAALTASGFTGIPDKVQTRVNRITEERTEVNFNVNLKEIGLAMGDAHAFGEHTPLAVLAVASRLMQSAAQLDSDILVSEPMHGFLCSQLSSAISNCQGAKENLKELSQRIDFPDLRTEVMRGSLRAKDVLRLRDKSESFRRWLHDTTELDKDIVASYLHDTAAKYNISPAMRKILRVIGSAVPPSVGVVAANALDGSLGTITGVGAAWATNAFLNELASWMMSGWSPKVFGAELKRMRDE